MLTLFSALRLLFLQCGEKRRGLWLALCSRRRWDREATQRFQRRSTPQRTHHSQPLLWTTLRAYCPESVEGCDGRECEEGHS